MKELSIPPHAATDPKATEMVRLWAANGKLDVSINIGCYENNGHDEAHAWGIIITDFARHVSRALAQRYGKNEEQELAKIRDGFLAELGDQTSEITGEGNQTKKENQASHTMAANARLFYNDPMEINLYRLGTSTEAAIVWIGRYVKKRTSVFTLSDKRNPINKKMKCLQCNSTRIVSNVRAVDFGDMDRRKDLTVEIAERPEAKIFKGMHEARVTASVCADCGFVMHSISKEDAERFFQVQETQKQKN